MDVGTDRTLRITSVTVHLHHVTVPRDYSSVRAETAQADARIAYADLSQTLGVNVHDDGNGRLAATQSVTIAGRRFSAAVSAVVHASSENGITFGDPKVSANGVSVPDAVSRAVATAFSKVISLSGLPFGVRVDGVEVTPAALVLRLSGRNLVYSR